jgi:hypothetical protein
MQPMRCSISLAALNVPKTKLNTRPVSSETLICINCALGLHHQLTFSLVGHQGAVALAKPETCLCVVDDDPGVLRAMDRLLGRHGYDTVLFESAEAFENHSKLEKALCLACSSTSI